MYDIIVCGGGSAGVATALFASLGGKKVLLAEQFGELGGNLTSDCLGYVMDAGNKTGFVRELCKSLATQVMPDSGNFKFDTEQMKYNLECRLLDAGVEIMYFSKVCGAETENGEITAVHFLCKDGFKTFSAPVYVDCTGDGDLAFYAGCGYDFGNEKNETQPMSFLALVSGINREEVKHFTNNHPDIPNPVGKKNFLEELRRAGVTPTYLQPSLSYTRDGVFSIGINHQYGSGIDSKNLTKATIEGRREVFRTVEALKALGGVWKNLSVISTPTYIGVREGRRIHGEYTVTVDDMINGVRHEDSVCRVTFCVDVHGKTGYSSEGVHVIPYDIPLRALKSKDRKNLYMAGRCISGEHLAHASYRVTGNTFTMGENLGKYLAKHI